MYPSLSNNGYYNENNHSKSNPHQESFYNNTPSSSSFLLPSPIYIPLEDEAVFCEFFQQQQQQPQQLIISNDQMMNTIDMMIPYNMESTATMEECSNNMNGHHEIATKLDEDETENSSQRKGTCKRDRHSKINTARGPRDRRMRLSLDVAKKFFGLQDLLGFDKASKTVDWLLDKSKNAIQELLPDDHYRSSSSASSTSECEVVSDQSLVMKTAKNIKAKSCCGSSKKQKEKVARVRKCVDFHHPLAKATRERARERARERTIEKRNNNNNNNNNNNINHHPASTQDSRFLDQQQFGSFWTTFQENQLQTINIQMTSNNFQVNQGFVGDNSSYFINYQHGSGT